MDDGRFSEALITQAADTQAEPIVCAHAVHVHYDVSAPWWVRAYTRTPRTYVRAVDGVSLRIARGQTLALVGESGCGKSTLGRLLVGLMPPTAGHVTLMGQALYQLPPQKARNVRRKVQMIFQDPYASLNPRWRVHDLIAEPIKIHEPEANDATIRTRVAELLNSVQLSARDADKYPHQFSGGQRQRICIARALASHPEFIVCDEPTSSLDVSVQAQVLNLMKDLQRSRGLTYLFISHNLALVRHIADQVGVMYLGKLVELADTDTLFAHPQHPYTRMLLAAAPGIHRSYPPCAPPQSDPLHSLTPPPGCAFHPRCPYTQTPCTTQAPALQPHRIGSKTTQVACHRVKP